MIAAGRSLKEYFRRQLIDSRRAPIPRRLRREFVSGSGTQPATFQPTVSSATSRAIADDRSHRRFRRSRRARRLGGEISLDTAGLGHRDLLDLPIQLYAYEPFADRVWALRDNASSYDGWYVAIAEHFDAPLATLDVGLAQSPGPTCEFLTPQGY